MCYRQHDLMLLLTDSWPGLFYNSFYTCVTGKELWMVRHRQENISLVLHALLTAAVIHLSVLHCCCLLKKHWVNQSRTVKFGRADSDGKMLLFWTDSVRERQRLPGIYSRSLDVSQTGIFLIFWSPFKEFSAAPSVYEKSQWICGKFLNSSFFLTKKPWQAILLKQDCPPIQRPGFPKSLSINFFTGMFHRVYRLELNQTAGNTLIKE